MTNALNSGESLFVPWELPGRNLPKCSLTRFRSSRLIRVPGVLATSL